MADWVWKGVNPLVLGRSCQLLLNKFFDPWSHSIRKGCGGEEEGKKKKRMVKIGSTFVVPVICLNGD